VFYHVEPGLTDRVAIWHRNDTAMQWFHGGYILLPFGMDCWEFLTLNVGPEF